MKTIAIIGATASGKSDLAFRLAQRLNGLILSLDTLSVYQHIDIASAKPSRQERDEITHFGVDVVSPDEPFGVMDFIPIVQQAEKIAKEQEQPLIIVGGSSFYLKSLIEGLSPLPIISDEVRQKAKAMSANISDAYAFLSDKDPLYMKAIKATR